VSSPAGASVSAAAVAASASEPPFADSRSTGLAESTGQSWRKPWLKTTLCAPDWATPLGSSTWRTVSIWARSVFTRAYWPESRATQTLVSSASTSWAS
jgi:hypothetical protein